MSAKLAYSPLFVKTFAKKHNLTKTYRGIKKRDTKRFQGKISGKIIKSRIVPDAKPRMTTSTLVASNGIENQLSKEESISPWRGNNLNLHLICPDCQQVPPDLIEENAETICGNCGRVLADRLISYESEWRTFNSDEKGGDDPNRVGDVESNLLHGTSGTNIGGGGGSISKEARRLKKAQQMQNEDKANRALQSAYALVESWGENDQVGPGVREQTKLLYKKVFDAGTFRGKNTNAILAGCLFIACRQSKLPRSFAEVTNITRVPKKDIGRIFKQLSNFFSTDAKNRIESIEADGGIVNHESLEFSNTQSSRPSDLITRFCAMLGLEYRVQFVATRIAEQIPNISSLAGRSPLSNAGASIYFACNLLGRRKTTAVISEVTNVSDATIKTAYKLLYAERQRIVQPDWLGPQQSTLKDKQEPLFGKMENLPNS